MHDDWKAATRQFFTSAAWRGLRYHGYRIGKNPLDLWIYAEVIQRVKPALIVEFGTMCGASGLFFCHQLDLLSGLPCGLQSAEVLSVEKSARHTPPGHPRATWIKGTVLSAAVYDQVAAAVERAAGLGPVLFSEDSYHHPDHVRGVLEQYAHFTTVGSYFVVEDGVLDHVMGQTDRAPYRAIQDWLRSPAGQAFTPDPRCEKFGITFHPSGWLQRRG